MDEYYMMRTGMMDAIVGVIRDAFAAVGVVATIAFVVGYFWAAPL